MATKYFCDICEKEVDYDNMIHISGFGKTNIRTLCSECWKKAEKVLLKIKKVTQITPNP